MRWVNFYVTFLAAPHWVKVVVLFCLTQNKDIRGEMNNVEWFLIKKSGHLPQRVVRHSLSPSNLLLFESPIGGAELSNTTNLQR